MDSDKDADSDSHPSRSKMSGTFNILSSVISSARLPARVADPPEQGSPSNSMALKGRVSINGGDSTALMYPPGLRRSCWLILDEDRGRFDYLMCVVILANVGLMVVETEGNADCAADTNIIRCRQDIITYLNQVFLVVYTTEFVIRFNVKRCKFWNCRWNLLDFSVVILGYVDLLLLVFKADKVPGPSMSLLRIFRVFRLMRAMKIFKKIKELHAMLRGFVSAMQSMFWGFVMISGLLLIFAILCVELVNPISIRVHGDNEYCKEAFAHVWYCMLMFFQALVAGDSWGQCTVPIIKEEAWTVIIFVIALVSIQLGFMNLILAVIVERAYDAKAQDEEEHRKDKEEKEMAATKRLRNLFETIDADHSGSISLEELLDGYDYNDDMKNMFAMLDMTRGDLETLFKLMDVDDEDDISYENLIYNLRTTIASDRKNIAMVRLQVAEVGRLIKKLHQDERTTNSFTSSAPSPIGSSFSSRANTRAMTRTTLGSDRAGTSYIDTISEISPLAYNLDAAKLGTALETLKLGEQGLRDQGSIGDSLGKTSSDLMQNYAQFSISESSAEIGSARRPHKRMKTRSVSTLSNFDVEIIALRDAISREFLLLRNSIRGLVDSMATNPAGLHKRDESIIELGSDAALERTIKMEQCLRKEDTGELLVKELNQFERRWCSPDEAMGQSACPNDTSASSTPRLWDNLHAQDVLRNAAVEKSRELRSGTKSLSLGDNDDTSLSGHRLTRVRQVQQLTKDSPQGYNGLQPKPSESPSVVQRKGDVSL